MVSCAAKGSIFVSLHASRAAWCILQAYFAVSSHGVDHLVFPDMLDCVPGKSVVTGASWLPLGVLYDCSTEFRHVSVL